MLRRALRSVVVVLALDVDACDGNLLVLGAEALVRVELTLHPVVEHLGRTQVGAREAHRQLLALVLCGLDRSRQNCLRGPGKFYRAPGSALRQGRGQGVDLRNDNLWMDDRCESVASRDLAASASGLTVDVGATVEVETTFALVITSVTVAI